MNSDSKLKDSYNLSINDYLILQRTIKVIPKQLRFQKCSTLFRMVIMTAYLCLFYFFTYKIISNSYSGITSSKRTVTFFAVFLLLIITLSIFKIMDLRVAIRFMRLFKPKYYKYSNKYYQPIKVTYNNNFRSIKKLPKYKDMNTFNIPMSIDYLAITKYWFLMLNDKFQVIGYFPRNIDEQIFCKYLTNKCNVKHIETDIIPSFGYAFRF